MPKPATRRRIAAGYLVCLYASLGIARPTAEWLRARGWLRLTVLVLFAPGITAALVWRSDAGRTRMLLRAGLTALLLAGAVVLAHTPEERLHFLTYGLLGWLIAWSMEGKAACMPLLLVGAAGIGDELIQGLLPNRVFDLRDILFNGISGMAGITLFALGRRPSS